MCYKDSDNKIILYTKGADSVIFQRLNPRENPNELVSKTALYLEDYANEGLRMYCIQSIDPQVYDRNKRYREASSSISDDREVLMGQLEEEIEQDLVLLGGIAIEDRLQHGVPQSISILE